jgi:outer membrane autotransporter protein
MDRRVRSALASLFLSTCCGSVAAATNVFYNDLANGRNTFDTLITGLGGTVSTDKLSGLASGVDTWVRADFTITASSNRSVSTPFTGSSAPDDDGQGITMTAATLGANPPGTLSASGLDFAFGSAVNAFAVELNDWATCCYPTRLYISFDGGSAILVGEAFSSADNPGFTDGINTFIGAIDDSSTFSTVTFWGEANGGDVLYGGGVIRWSLLPIGALSGPSVYNSSVAQSNSPAYGAAVVIDDTPALLQLFSAAGLSTDQEVSDGATQTLPLLVGSTTIPTLNTLSGINRVIQARQDVNRGMSSGDDFSEDKYFWMKPFGSWIEHENRDNVFGFDANTWGLIVGADKAISDSTRLGFAVAYASTDVDSKSAPAPHDVDIDMFELIGYGSRNLDQDTEVNFQIDLGYNWNEGKRTIAFTSTQASSDYDSYTAHLGVGITRAYQVNDKSRLFASLRADYTYIKDESYRESGAGLLNLDVDDRSSDELIIGVDGKLNHKINEDTDFQANLGVGYDLLNERASVTSTFAGAPGLSFTTDGLKPSPWVGRAGLGIVHNTPEGTEITLRLDTEFRDDFLNKTASVKARWPF